MSEWISVDDRVPAVDSGDMTSSLIKVITNCGDEYFTKYSRVTGFNDYSVTHWKCCNSEKN